MSAAGDRHGRYRGRLGRNDVRIAVARRSMLITSGVDGGDGSRRRRVVMTVWTGAERSITRRVGRDGRGATIGSVVAWSVVKETNAALLPSENW